MPQFLFLLQDFALSRLANLVAGPPVYAVGAGATVFCPQARDAQPTALPLLAGLGSSFRTGTLFHGWKSTVRLLQTFAVVRAAAGVFQSAANERC